MNAQTTQLAPLWKVRLEVNRDYVHYVDPFLRKEPQGEGWGNAVMVRQLCSTAKKMWMTARPTNDEATCPKCIRKAIRSGMHF